MERKLVKQGKNALTVTLPHEWIKKNGLTEKDVILIEEDRNILKVQSSKAEKRTEVTLNVTDKNRKLIYHIVNGAYIEGYDKIIIKHNNFKVAQDIPKVYLGMVVEQNEENLLVLNNIISVPEDNFQVIFKRTCQMLIALARTLRKVISKEITGDEVKIQERIIDHHILYCLRYINKYKNVEDANKYLLLISTLEAVGDSITIIANKLVTQKTISKNDKETCEIVINMIEKFVYFLFQKNMEGIFELMLDAKKRIKRDTYVNGVAYSIREALYNYIGYLVK